MSAGEAIQDAEVAALRDMNKELIDDLAKKRRMIVDLTSKNFALKSRQNDPKTGDNKKKQKTYSEGFCISNKQPQRARDR